MRLIYTFVLVILVSFATFPQLSGTYYIGAVAESKPGGGNPDYATFGAAISALNTNGVGGACTFYFLDANYTESTNLSLGCTGTSATNTVTFKPYTGVTANITFTDSATSATIDGHLVIGSPNASTQVSTNYVTFDGSNNGTQSKDLTFTGRNTAFTRSVIRIYGNCDYITVKNCIIINRSSSASSTAPILLTNVATGSVAPDNVLIQNNTLTSNSGNGGIGVIFTASGSPTVGVTGAIVRSNVITARATRALMFNYVSDAEISGNTISQDCQLGTGAAACIWLSTGTTAAGTFNIFGNKITMAKTWNNAAGPTASNGIIGIDNQFASPKIVNIYNNFIAGFTISSSSVQGVKIYGIRQTGSSTTNVYHNTIHIPEMTNMTTQTGSFIAGIAFASNATTEASPGSVAVMNAKNNIVYVSESSMKTYCIRRAGTTGTFTSNNNNLYIVPANTASMIGAYNAVDQATLANWQSASSQDANSKNVSVSFTSATDLHITAPDMNLVGTTGLGISTDIDGDTRSGSYPYIGADESTSYPLPVELAAFSADVKNGSAVLNWKTATEVNAFAFVVERATVTSTDLQWTEIGRVMAAGNANSSRDYSYRDANTLPGKMAYRLRMVDNDGTYKYSKTVEVDVTVPKEFTVSQNYPNPFNPATRIDFSLPQDAQVQLEIFAISGEKVATVTNGNFATGTHAVTVNMQSLGLGSGVYLYRVQAVSVSGERFVQTKKMVMLK